MHPAPDVASLLVEGVPTDSAENRQIPGVSRMSRAGITRKSFLKLAGGFALGAGLLDTVACGPAAPGGTSGATGATAAPAGTSGGQVTLRFMTHNTLEKPAGDYLRQVVDAFQTAHPNIKIAVEDTPNADVFTKLTAAAAGGDIPDVIDAQNGGIAGFQSLNAALDITDRVKQAGLEDLIYPAYLQGSRTVDGRYLALPLYGGSDALYYRTDYFQEAGLDPSKPPRTWPDLANAATKLTQADKGRYGMALYGKVHTIRVLYFMEQAGPDGNMLRRESGSDKWDILVNSPDSQKAWQFLVDLARVQKAVPPNVVEMDYPAVVSAFAGGNIAMMTTGPWGAQTLIATNQDLDGKFGVGPFPTPDGKAPVLQNGPVIYGIGRTSQHPDEAFEFLKWMCVDHNADFTVKAGYGPTIKSAAEMPEVKNDRYLPVFLEEAKTSVAEPFLNLPEWPKMMDAYTAEWQAALTGAKPVKDAVNASANQFAGILGQSAVLKYPTT
jgi:ABC-type glycerol-3-phosphate transport system substrate-binding protein